jgi:hypothetical protein
VLPVVGLWWLRRGRRRYGGGEAPAGALERP